MKAIDSTMHFPVATHHTNGQYLNCNKKHVFIEIFLCSSGITGKIPASAFIFLLALLHKFDPCSLKFYFFINCYFKKFLRKIFYNIQQGKYV